MLTQKANAGDVLAQYELGIRYLMGRGIQADTAKGAYWTRKAAEQNMVPARFNLGILLYNGWGVPWNPFEAYRHFLYCASEQMVEAEYVLSGLYIEDLVVARNWEEAYRWAKKAADSGYEPAQAEVAMLLKRGVVKNDSTAHPSDRSGSSVFEPVFLDFGTDTAKQVDDQVLRQEAIREGNLEVKNALGTIHGDTLSVDSVGLQSIRHAASTGSPEAYTILGRCYEKGVGVKKDLVLASVEYLRAIRLDSPRAPGLLMTLLDQKEYGQILRTRAARDDADAEYAWSVLTALGFDGLVKGQGVLVESQALQFLQKAVAHKHTAATIELGLCYYSGRWVERDRIRATELWEEAVAMGSMEAKMRIAATGVLENDEALIPVLRDGLKENSILAEVGLAYAFERGVGMEKNIPEAVYLYREAAQRGSQDAYHALQRMNDQIRPGSSEFQMKD